MTLEDSVIRAKDLYKGFAIKGGVLPALDHLSLSVKRGELTAVIGPDGAGKTIVGPLSRPAFQKLSAPIGFQ